jgi:hypothetical protein
MAVISNKAGNRPKRRTGRKMKAKKTVKRRSDSAMALASPLYRKRVVRSAKLYSRKRGPRAEQEDPADA